MPTAAFRKNPAPQTKVMGHQTSNVERSRDGPEGRENARETHDAIPRSGATDGRPQGQQGPHKPQATGLLTYKTMNGIASVKKDQRQRIKMASRKKRKRSKNDRMWETGNTRAGSWNTDPT